jgi:hypothetical protein
MTAIKVAHLAKNLNKRIADPTGPRRATKRIKGAHDYLSAAAQLLNTSLSGLSVMVGASPSAMSCWAVKDEMPETIFHGVEGLLAKAAAGQPLIETAALIAGLEAREERNNATLASRISEATHNGTLDLVVAAAPPPAPPAPPAPVDAPAPESVPMFLVRPCTAALAETVQRLLSALQVEFTPA